MHVPRWKKWLSYIAEIHIESTTSEYNPHLYVSLRNGRFQLSTAHAIYSYGDLYSNFGQAFQMIDFDQIKGEEVLILGLGLGSIITLLEQKINRRYHFTAVEIDEAVLDLANRYSLPNLQSSIELICADAHAFVMQAKSKFDLICMDIFLDDEVPMAFESSEFLEALRDALHPQGLLLYNRLAAQRKDIQRTRAFYEQCFLPVFPNATFIDLSGNWMLFSQKDLANKAKR